MVPRNFRPALLLALALLVPTAFLLHARLSLRVDATNRALKSVGTPEARALEQRRASFGEDATVLLDFELAPSAGAKFSDAEAAALARLAERIGALPGVRAVRAWPREIPGARVWAVELAEGNAEYAPLVAEIERVARASTPASISLAVSGQPVAEMAIAREVQAEQGRVLPWIAAGLFALLLVLYRHVGLVLAIVLPAAAGMAWTGGLFALLGRELDPVSVMLDPVLLTVGIASGVHYVEAFLDRTSAGDEVWTAALYGVRELFRPAALAAVTTVIGFGALAVNVIPAVVDFGLFAALGVALTFVLAQMLTPVLLGAFARRISREWLARRGSIAGERGLRASDWIARRAASVRVIAAAVALAGLWTTLRITVDNDPVRVLPREHTFRRDTERIAAHIGGSDVLDVLVPAASALAQPTQLTQFASEVFREPGVAAPLGFPQTAANGDRLVRALLAPSGSHERELLFQRIEDRARELGAADVRATGTAVQVARDSGRLVRSQLAGTLASVALLFLVFWIGLRSAKLGALGLIPNVLPCLVIYGGLALAGRSLSVTTAMISSVLLGLIVDDTIHLLHRFQGERARGASALLAVEHVFRHSGRAIVITSLVLGGGFALAMLGELSTTFEFGALAATTIFVALLADLVLLPALLVEPNAARATQPEACRA